MRMKDYLLITMGLALMLLSGCKKDDVVEPEELVISYEFVDDQTVRFEHNNPIDGVSYWDFGNGEISREQSATIVYPLAGTYTVTLTLTKETTVLQDTIEVVITSSNAGLLDLTEDETLLCGGTEAENGKTWVWAKGVPQHMMLAQFNPWQWWWGAAPFEKEAFNMYDDKMIFKAVNKEYILVNNDSTYFNIDYTEGFGGTGEEDQTLYYNLSGSAFKWSINNRDGANYLTLTNGGFLSYYTGASEYRIEELSENEMTVSSVVENVQWTFILMTEGYDHPDAVDPEEPVVNDNLSPATHVEQLVDDFETDAEILWLFQAEGGGGSGDDEAANPAIGGIDTSATVYQYVKGGFEYSNAFMELDFDLDLTTHSRIGMKVYLPSSNTYNPGETGLKQKVSVKLQDWTQSAPWTTQAEVIFEDVALNTWTELIFDYNSITIPADRKTGYFNKIVIQFGDEGHTENGTFYFDDFAVLADE